DHGASDCRVTARGNGIVFQISYEVGVRIVVRHKMHLPSFASLKITAQSDWHSRAAVAAMVSTTGWRSDVDWLMTPSTSLVAVCRSRESERSSVRCRNSLSKRAFSMAMTA